MKQPVKVTFWLYKAKKNAKNLVPIYMRVQLDYEFFKRATGNYTIC